MKYDEIQTPEELYAFMKENFIYGFTTKDNKTYSRKELNDDQLYEKLLFSSYKLQTPNELLINKYGVCFDQVEFERDWFLNHNYEVHTYYIDFHNHVFLIYKDTDNKYCYFERTLKKNNGIYKRDSLNEILNLFKDIQIDESGENDITIKFYEYKDVPFGCSSNEFLEFLKRRKLYVKL